jgi:hypothetical protein
LARAGLAEQLPHRFDEVGAAAGEPGLTCRDLAAAGVQR